jgi:hypothetical protein
LSAPSAADWNAERCAAFWKVDSEDTAISRFCNNNWRQMNRKVKLLELMVW